MTYLAEVYEQLARDLEAEIDRLKWRANQSRRREKIGLADPDALALAVNDLVAQGIEERSAVAGIAAAHTVPVGTVTRALEIARQRAVKREKAKRDARIMRAYRAGFTNAEIVAKESMHPVSVAKIIGKYRHLTQAEMAHRAAALEKTPRPRDRRPWSRGPGAANGVVR